MTNRHDYIDDLAWRTERGFTDTFESMLTQRPRFHPKKEPERLPHSPFKWRTL